MKKISGKKSGKNVENRQKTLKIGDFQRFFNFFFNIFFSTFFEFLGSTGTKQNFIFLVKSHFPEGFVHHRRKRNMQKIHAKNPENATFFGCYFFLSGSKTVKESDFSSKG